MYFFPFLHLGMREGPGANGSSFSTNKQTKERTRQTDRKCGTKMHSSRKFGHTYDTVSLRGTVMIRGRIGSSARQEGRWQQVEEGAKNGGHFLRLAGSGTTRLLVVGVVCCRLHHCGLRPPAVHTAAALHLPALLKRQPRGSHLMIMKMMIMMRPIVFLLSI